MNLLIALLLSINVLNYSSYDVEEQVTTHAQELGIENVTIVVVDLIPSNWEQDVITTKNNDIYHIYLPKKLKGSKLEYSVAHGVEHINQYVTNQLIQNSENIVTWRGKKYNTNYLKERNFRPWEIAAHKETMDRIYP